MLMADYAANLSLTSSSGDSGQRLDMPILNYDDIIKLGRMDIVLDVRGSLTVRDILDPTAPIV